MAVRFVVNYRRIENNKWVSDDGLWHADKWQDLHEQLKNASIKCGADEKFIHDTPVYQWSRLFIAYTNSVPTQVNTTKPDVVKVKPDTKPVTKQKQKTPEPEEDMGLNLFD